MEENLRLLIKTWYELNKQEMEEMNKSRFREWKNPPMNAEHHEKNIFFLLKNNQEKILAQGQLVPINDVIFNGETLNIFGIGGIIANTKKRGYGRRIMHAIKEYLVEQDKSGVGFIGLPEFYKKCGFSVSKEAISRFVHIVGDEKRINTESDHIAYLDSSDRFMEKVIRNLDKVVYLPRDPDW